MINLSIVPAWVWKVAASLAVAFIAFKAIENRGAQKAVAKVTEQTHAKIETAKRASAAVPSDGAADRLRREYCPACR